VLHTGYSQVLLYNNLI